jgi:alpha/beta superfamily hydrolase
MRTFSLSLLLTFLLTVQTLAQESPITLTTPTGNIYGTLMLPSGDKKAPVALIIAGSGPTDRNCNQPTMSSNAYKMLAEELAKNGIASVRYDKRGIGESKVEGLKEKDMRFDNFIADARRWVDMLAADKRFSKVVVAGHSEGSLIGIIVCEPGSKATGFISIAGSGRPMDVLLREQFQSQPEEIRSAAFLILDTLKRGDTLRVVPPYLYSVFRPSVQPYVISLLKYDPIMEIKRLAIPILIVQGSTDIQVKVEDARLLSGAVPKAKLKIIDNMNHVLKDCPVTDMQEQLKVYRDPVKPLSPEFIPAVTTFINGL